MPRRKLLAAVALAGSIATVLVRRRTRRRERVDVYFEDGSMISLTDGSADASTIIPLARRILETTLP